MRKVFIVLAVTLLSSNAKVTQCSWGEYYNKTDDACRHCRPGTFSDGTVLLSECTPCPTGKISTKFRSYRCDSCPDGTFAKDGITCELCPAGTSAEYGTGVCTPCKAGFYSLQGSEYCHACPAATYAEHGSHCKKCPVGYSAPQGSTKLSDCFACAPGTIVPTGAGASGPLTTGTCNTCGKGTYEVDNLNCEKCPIGTTTLKTGASDISQCKRTCPPGSPYDEQADKCLPCAPGSYESDGLTCDLCPAGTTSSLGAKDKSECVSCPAGYVAGSGDDGCYMCPENTYEANRTSCKNCPKGTVSEEGSSSLGSCTVPDFKKKN